MSSLPIQVNDLTVFAKQVKMHCVGNQPMTAQVVEDVIITTLQKVSPLLASGGCQFSEHPTLMWHFVITLNNKHNLGVTYTDLMEKTPTPGELAINLYIHILARNLHQ